MSKITIPKTMIDRIRNEIISSILIDKKVKLDSKKNIKLSPIDHGVIADSVLNKIRTPKDGSDGKDGKDLIYTEQIRKDLIETLLPRIPTPLDGNKGERGRKGESGSSGKDYALTDQDRLDISEIAERATAKNVNRMFLNLIADIKTGKISRPNAGLGPKEALDLINIALSSTDWQSGGTDPITTRGDVIRGDSSGDAERLELGTNGQVLGSNGTDLVYISIPGGGDMLKSVYDTGDNGVVDNSEALGGQNSAYHLSRTNHSGTQAASTISDFDTEVSNETNVAANTTHRSSDGKNHSDVVTNNAKISYTDSAAVGSNTTHRTSDGKDHSDVVLNNTHRGSGGSDHSIVTANQTKLGNYDPAKLTVSSSEPGSPSTNDLWIDTA